MTHSTPEIPKSEVRRRAEEAERLDTLSTAGIELIPPEVVVQAEAGRALCAAEIREELYLAVTTAS
jgi:hypothetical protein